ncbi:MAG: hypothetical protein RLZZ519_3440 [Bacteroidota bacterium]|jgi:hypothetical protein
MPSYSNIESYHRIENQDFTSYLQKFRRVLEAIGLWNASVDSGFQKLKIEIDDWGQIDLEFPSMGAFPTIGFKENVADVPIAPFVSAESRITDDGAMEFWLGFGFWIESALLEDYPNYRFAPHAFQFLPALKQAMAKEFPDHPIYLTNELSDGKPRDFVVGRLQSANWEFDYALIPRSYFEDFSDPPSTHVVFLKDDILEASDLRFWRPYEVPPPGQ